MVVLPSSGERQPSYTVPTPRQLARKHGKQEAILSTPPPLPSTPAAGPQPPRSTLGASSSLCESGITLSYPRYSSIPTAARGSCSGLWPSLCGTLPRSSLRGSTPALKSLTSAPTTAPCKRDAGRESSDQLTVSLDGAASSMLGARVQGQWEGPWLKLKGGKNGNNDTMENSRSLCQFLK